MSKKRTEIVSKLFAIFLVAELLLLPYASASALKFPSASKIAGDLEKRYHLNTGSIQNAGETFNVAGNKQTVPEVSLFFNPSDPKEGQKISAKAFPVYFGNPSNQLYYTWFLKQRYDGGDCSIDTTPSVAKKNACDDDGDGEISENDWKVRAARIIALNGYDNESVRYSPAGANSDSDGFEATNSFGGALESGKENWCYLYDAEKGTTYELVKSSVSFDNCDQDNGDQPVCISEIMTTSITSGDSFSTTFVESTEEVSTGAYFISGAPSCVNKAASCPGGATARCLEKSDEEPYTTTSGSAPGACVAGDAKSSCDHIFPSTNGHGTTGDGDFDNDEEEFWRTDPIDADTADNGGKDEANVIGLGIESFTWNYQSGDMVGVGVEGTSNIATKHDDSSNMIMWAFSKNKCKVGTVGGYTTSVKGYKVYIPTTEKNIDDCIEDNLVDPLEGGQAKKLEVEVTVSPDGPTNDETAEKGGDTVTASASVMNSAKPVSETLYTWKVSLSNNQQAGFQDITAALVTAGLLQGSTGNGLDSISISLNMQTEFLKDPDGPGGNAAINFNGDDPLYLKIAPTVTENFSATALRKGTSDVIVRISNTTNKVVAYSVNAAVSEETYRVSYDDPICNTYYGDLSQTALDSANVTLETALKENLNRIACRVMKNEIIGLQFADKTGLSSFQWTLNGASITCSTNISDVCDSGIFFAVAGSPGETYTIKATAVDTETGKAVTLTRMFQIVEPELSIESDDQTGVWPKYIGTHADLDGTAFDEYSDIAFETYGTGNIKLKAKFFPNEAGKISNRVWMIDGAVVSEASVNPADWPYYKLEYAPVTPKLPGEVYNVSLSADLLQPAEKRQALRDIWGIDALASSDIKVSESIQVTVVESEEIAQGPKKFFAALSSYLPASVLFAFKITLSMALLLFTVGFVFALIPAEPRTDEVILSRRD